MALYAIGDFHLSFQANKPMDQFGSVWRKHEEKIQKYCSRLIRPEDTLVITGDHSWGRKLEECREDKFYEYIIAIRMPSMPDRKSAAHHPAGGGGRAEACILTGNV